MPISVGCGHVQIQDRSVCGISEKNNEMLMEALRARAFLVVRVLVSRFLKKAPQKLS